MGLYCGSSMPGNEPVVVLYERAARLIPEDLGIFC
jgi:hypothetical protein